MAPSLLCLDLCESLSDGQNIHDAALRCGISASTAKRELVAFYGRAVGRAQPSRPEFAAGLAMLLLERGHVTAGPEHGSDWDDLLATIRQYLRRHRLVAPGFTPSYPGSSKFSLTEQAAMVRKYLRAREANHSTPIIGQMYMKWGITAAMMDKWRMKLLGPANPHYRDSSANKQREKLMRVARKARASPIRKAYFCRHAPELTPTQLSNRLRELCSAGRLKSIYTPRKFHLGYKITGT